MVRLKTAELLKALKGFSVEAPAKATNKDLEKLLAKAEKAAAKAVKAEKAEAGADEGGDEGEDRLESEATSDEDEADDGERLEAPSQELPKDEVKGDYLRQYQYRKGAVFGSEGSDPQPGSRAAIMKASLLKQPTVRIFITRGPGESPKIPLSVGLNGYRLDYPKQAYIDMPEQVAEVVMNSLSQTEEAILRGQITGDTKKEGALL